MEKPAATITTAPNVEELTLELEETRRQRNDALSLAASRQAKITLLARLVDALSAPR